MTLPMAGLLIASWGAMAAGLDGKWTAEMTARGAKGGETKVVTTFDFKVSGEALTGTVSAGTRRAKHVEILEGTMAGNQFSFKTKQTTKKGESVNVWEGTWDGDSLKGTRAREGAKRVTGFMAKRGS